MVQVRGSQLVSVSLLALAILLGQQQALVNGQAAASASTGGLIGGLTGSLSGSAGGLAGGLGGLTNGLTSGLGGLTNSLGGAGGLGGILNGVTKPLNGVLGGLLPGSQGLGNSMFRGGVKLNEISEHPIVDGMNLLAGTTEGLVTGAAAASDLGGVSRATRLGAALGAAGSAGALSGAMTGAALAGASARNAIATNSYMHGVMGAQSNSALAGSALAAHGANQLAAARNLLANGAGALSSPLNPIYSGAQSGALGAVKAGLHEAAIEGAATSAAATGAAVAGAQLAGAANLANSAIAGPVLASQVLSNNRAGELAVHKAVAADHAAALAGSSAALASDVVGRQALAADAFGNAQAEAAIAGNDMAAHGANNARSASLASNAYRQAKLVGTRDRMNIAGTIQNSARISDAAIATHDTATKAEDSLLGSELAVDSAATVLDSDAAYIPPVTNSMLRSLPYGRLGLRNIVPKPLTYPSVLLPDVWLNGAPVNYLNVPFRMLPYGVGSTAATNTLLPSGGALANGFLLNGQPFLSNNGLFLNGFAADHSLGLLTNNLQAVAGSSVYPILVNGQLEARDETAMAHLLNQYSLHGAGQSATYNGFGRLNSVPMLTGSVSEAQLTPTTTIGTTYPIGSALVVEPRDSYFQDYIDNASSRQNFDERQQ